MLVILIQLFSCNKNARIDEDNYSIYIYWSKYRTRQVDRLRDSAENYSPFLFLKNKDYKNEVIVDTVKYTYSKIYYKSLNKFLDSSFEFDFKCLIQQGKLKLKLDNSYKRIVNFSNQSNTNISDIAEYTNLRDYLYRYTCVNQNELLRIITADMRLTFLIDRIIVLHNNKLIINNKYNFKEKLIVFDSTYYYFYLYK